jgi:hypothetical protein
MCGSIAGTPEGAGPQACSVSSEGRREAMVDDESWKRAVDHRRKLAHIALYIFLERNPGERCTKAVRYGAYNALVMIPFSHSSSMVV